jgi:uncharacterized membrane protein
MMKCRRGGFAAAHGRGMTFIAVALGIVFCLLAAMWALAAAAVPAGFFTGKLRFIQTGDQASTYALLTMLVALGVGLTIVIV